MTVAVDIQTGKVIGQIVALLPPTTLKRTLPSNEPALVILTGNGYQEVAESSVRVEHVE